MDAASGGSSVSLCMADAYPDDMYHMLRLACETQSPSRVVYELDPSYWMNEQRSGSTQIFFYQEFPAPGPSFYFLDKIINLDFRSALAPWSYYRNLIRPGPGPYYAASKALPIKTMTHLSWKSREAITRAGALSIGTG